MNKKFFKKEKMENKSHKVLILSFLTHYNTVFITKVSIGKDKGF